MTLTAPLRSTPMHLASPSWKILRSLATNRIVLVAPSAEGMTLSLAKPKSGDEALVGRQAGQRVFVFIDTENLETDLTRFAEKQVEIMDGPRTEIIWPLRSRKRSCW